MPAKKSTTDYEVISEARGRIVVGTFNFHLMGTSRPPTYEHGGKTYLFSQLVEVPEEFEHQVCSAAEYRLVRGKPTQLDLTVAVCKAGPEEPSRILRHPYFQAATKKRWGFIIPGYLRLRKT